MEVRDVGPLGGVEFVDGHRALVVALVAAQHAEVKLVQPVPGQRLAALGHLVNRQFELGKHGLAEDGGAQTFQEVTQEGQSGLVVRRLGDQVTEEQHLVDSGGDLGDEDRVVGGGIGLCFLGVPGVHQVAALVGQRGGAQIVVEVVQQHVGMHVVRRVVDVGARALARPRVDVDPAFLERLVHSLDVLFTQRRQRLQYQLLRILPRIVGADVLYQRRIRVVVAQVVDTQDLAAQPQVALQCGDIRANLFQQHVVDVGVDLVAGQRGFQRRFVIAYRRVDDVLLDRRGDRCGQRALECLQGVVERLVARDAVFAIIQAATLAETGRVHAQLFTVCERDRGPGDLGVAQQTADGVADAFDAAHVAQQFLGLGVEYVRSLRLESFEVATVDLEVLVLLQETGELLRWYLENFRIDPRRGGLDSGHHVLQRLQHALGAGFTQVLVAAHACVGAETRGLLLQGVHLLQRFTQYARAGAETALVLVEQRLLACEILQRVVPRFVADVDLGQVPVDRGIRDARGRKSDENGDGQNQGKAREAVLGRHDLLRGK